jgi:hypothetical protein
MAALSNNNRTQSANPCGQPFSLVFVLKIGKKVGHKGVWVLIVSFELWLFVKPVNMGA